MSSEVLPAPAPVGSRGTLAATVRGYVALTKPRIIELLLVTTLPPMILAARGFPSWWLIVATLVGGSFAAGSANTINCYLDRDIDKVMHRTRARPLAAGVSITPVNALRFGLLLGAAATALLGFARQLAVRAARGRRDRRLRLRLHPRAQAADAVEHRDRRGGWLLPGDHRLVGGHRHGRLARRGAVRDRVLLDPAALLGARDALPRGLRVGRCADAAVVATPRVVARRILGYSYGMVAISLLLVPSAGWVYGAVALAAGAGFLVEAHRLLRRVESGADPRPMRLFHLSISYLTIVFLAVAVVPFL